MDNQQLLVKDQEQPVLEEYPGDTASGQQKQREPGVIPPQYEEGAYASGRSSVQPYSAWTPSHWQPAYSPRRTSRWPWIVLTIFLLFLLAIGGVFLLFASLGYNLAGYTNRVTETRQFSVVDKPTFVLHNDTDSIHIRAGNSGSLITVLATKYGSPGVNLSDIQVSYGQNSDMKTVTIAVSRSPNVNFMNAAVVDFDVTVPPATSLQLDTSTGSIDVSGVSGVMALRSSTGSLEVNAGTMNGDSELITNTGSVTFNGSISQSGSYRFETNTGSVNVTLPGNSAFHLDASTDTGSINTNFPGVIVQHHQVTGADAQGDVGNSPQATVILRTNTGSINLYSR